jgi:tRNA (guanine-N7-)-methyltransferase
MTKLDKAVQNNELLKNKNLVSDHELNSDKTINSNPQIQTKIIRSFGRIKSRKLSEHKNCVLETILPLYERITGFSFAKTEKNILEIGFGFGDFLFEKVKKNPSINFFGCEPHINGVVNLLTKLEKEPLTNLQISRQDVRILIPDFPDKFFDEIYILFPDPWPKTKHFKRRLITTEFLDEVLSLKIKNAGRLIIATDHDSYKTWILSQLLRSKKFSWNANSKKDWLNFPDDWIQTKYQKKAIAEGRIPMFFESVVDC